MVFMRPIMINPIKWIPLHGFFLHVFLWFEIETWFNFQLGELLAVVAICQIFYFGPNLLAFKLYTCVFFEFNYNWYCKMEVLETYKRMMDRTIILNSERESGKYSKRMIYLPLSTEEWDPQVHIRNSCPQPLLDWYINQSSNAQCDQRLLISAFEQKLPPIKVRQPST